MCDLVMRIPDRVDFQEATTLPACLLIAYQAFNLKSWPHKAQSHEPVLVLGADTTPGLCAVQLAHVMGYKVIAVADNEYQKIIEQYGSDVFINKDSTDLSQKIRDATQNNLRLSIVTNYYVSLLPLLRRNMIYHCSC